MPDPYLSMELEEDFPDFPEEWQLKDWDESEHPRDDHGKFTDVGDDESVSETDFSSTAIFEKIGGGVVDPKTKYGDHTDNRPGVEMYAGLGNSYELNDSLRKGERLTDVYEKILNDLTDDINKTPLPTGIVAFRFVKPEFAEQLKVGSNFTDLGFVSTTLSPKIIEKHRASVTAKAGATLRLHIPKGKAATAVKGSSEYEVIVQRGSQFKVTNIKEIGGSNSPRWRNKIIDVDVI